MESRLRAAADDVCEVQCVNEEKVTRLRPAVRRTTGAAEIFKALADETRVNIVYALAHEELCVCDVAALLGVSEKTASYHLRLLRHMGLAKHRKEGKLVYYSLQDHHITTLIQTVIEHVGEERPR